MSWPPIEPMTSAQRVNYLREQLRYRLQDAHDILNDLRGTDQTSAHAISSATIHLEVACRRLYAAFERLLELGS